MSNVANNVVVPSAPPSGWLKSAPVDALLAFGWVPFWLWIMTTPLVGSWTDPDFGVAFAVASVIALSVNFIHRHFVYFLFFGDAAQRQRHPRAVWLAPVAAVFVAALKLMPAEAFSILLGALATWNIWHVLMQRHGILRAYAAKSGGGVDARAQGRRDLSLLAALLLVTAAAVIKFRQASFFGAASKIFRALPLLPRHPDRQTALLVVTCVIAVAVFLWWARGELSATPRTSRAPRLLFLASTVALFGVFVVHGPIIGYIVFAFAHSVEYIVFVHIYTKRRAHTAGAPWGIRALGRGGAVAIVSASLLLIFSLAYQVWAVPVFVVYYSTTSILHYLYDGLIWKMRRPEVRAPFVAASAEAAPQIS